MSTFTLSEPVSADLVIYRGDSGGFRVTVTADDGTPIDVSTASWLCQIRPAPDAGPPFALAVTPTVGDPSSVDVFLSADTSERLRGNGRWDLQMSVGDAVATLLAGTVRVTKDISIDA